MTSLPPFRLTLPAGPAAPAVARRALQGVDGLPPGREADLALLVSEVVTNAVLHADGDEVVVEARFADHHVRVEVRDGGPGFDPATAEGRPDGGFGLAIVERVARRWGVDPGVVWFEL